MTDFKELLLSAKQMKEKMELVQEALKKLEVTGEAGGNFAVRVTLNGEGQLIKIDFDDSLLKESKEIIQDLIIAGHNQAVKNLATADSGMICFKDSSNHEFVKKLTWMGIDKDTYSRTQSDGSYKWKYNVPHLGFKYHGNSIMATIGLVQLKYLDDDNNYRNEIANYYYEKLTTLNKISTIKTSDYCYRSSRHLFQIIVDKSLSRDRLVEFLQTNDIYPGVHYRDNTKYDLYSSSNGSCPRAHDYSERILSLPLHLNLVKGDIDRIIDTINNFLKS